MRVGVVWALALLAFDGALSRASIVSFQSSRSNLLLLSRCCSFRLSILADIDANTLSLVWVETDPPVLVETEHPTL
jgi:hypothetical protein